MKQPKVTALYPAEVFLEESKIYNWCACGRSLKEPFCDGSHEGTGLKPIPYQVVKSKTVFLCLCKHSKNPPICDGSHNDLIVKNIG
jgi:CDGSH-type Zn-finger protein